MKRWLPVLFVLICFVALPLSAARKDKPTGKEIADKGKAAKLDSANATTGEKGGKKIKFTPADLPHVKSDADLEAGQVIGVLETEAAGDETALSPGKCDLFLAKVGTEWHVYAESGGQVVAEAVRVKVEKMTEKPKSLKAEFRASGWCFSFPTCWNTGWPWDWACGWVEFCY